jgi:cation diffusion facilitator CzcD-associated flavoprotein CzcO
MSKRFTIPNASYKDELLTTGYLTDASQKHRPKVSRDLVANLVAEQLNHDPRLTEKITPKFPVGCRRMTPGSGYLQSLTKMNVQVVIESAVRITEDGVIDEPGNELKVDAIICVTGLTSLLSPTSKSLATTERA